MMAFVISANNKMAFAIAANCMMVFVKTAILKTKQKPSDLLSPFVSPTAITNIGCYDNGCHNHGSWHTGSQ